MQERQLLLCLYYAGCSLSCRASSIYLPVTISITSIFFDKIIFLDRFYHGKVLSCKIAMFRLSGIVQGLTFG